MDDHQLQTDEAMTEDRDMTGEHDDEEYDEGAKGLFDDEDDEDDEDAEAVAKRLGEALWEDINKAYAQRATESALPTRNHALPAPCEHGDDEQNLVEAIQIVLRLASAHADLHNALACATVPGTDNHSLLELLTRAEATRQISPELACTASNLVQSIADKDLFAAAVQVDDAE